MTTPQTAIVTGTSRGFGAGIATALEQAGRSVVGVARSGGSVRADAADPEVAAELIAKYEPTALVLNAGATPAMAPIHEQTWADFDRIWQVDTKQIFAWVRESLLAPLAPGSTVLAFSSAAVLGGSPWSGGYASAKQAIRYVMAYAAAESERLGLGLRFVTVLPTLTPHGGVGAAGVAGYARRQGVDVPTFVAGLEAPLTPAIVGAQVLELLTAEGPAHSEHLLTGAGIKAVP
jgi:NAD(P)-dependent dehydrogenase (short-subunit alcohol dehydrogenase family)